MLLTRCGAWILAASFVVFGARMVLGQEYPNKPVRIVASGVGGGGDFVARIIAQGISGPLGQQVIVENRGGIASGGAVVNAPPDGHVLLHAGSSHWLGQFFIAKMPYDAVKDFLPITMGAMAPYILVVHPSLPVKSVKELIALAKARPGALNYGAGSIGSPGHLAGELFKAAAGVNVVGINFKGGGPALIGLVSGEVQLSFATVDGVPPHLTSGRLRGLAVTSAQPSILFPGVPTMVAAGVPEFEVVTMLGLFAPAKTPTAIINRLNQEVVRFLRTPEAKERLLAGGFEAVGSSPEQLAASITSEIARMGKVIRSNGIRPE